LDTISAWPSRSPTQFPTQLDARFQDAEIDLRTPSGKTLYLTLDEPYIAATAASQPVTLTAAGAYNANPLPFLPDWRKHTSSARGAVDLRSWACQGSACQLMAPPPRQRDQARVAIRSLLAATGLPGIAGCFDDCYVIALAKWITLYSKRVARFWIMS
jgi:hypothetical protein